MHACACAYVRVVRGHVRVHVHVRVCVWHVRVHVHVARELRRRTIERWPCLLAQITILVAHAMRARTFLGVLTALCISARHSTFRHMMHE